ncbi:MAG: family acetyltransferase [Gammaproteobacteria bacterium]|jgi:ribosomal protein S18 acetylase RimI-like enzyme|nr:family acetyltransferase [Gammaproteobacteria bacterium]
MFKTVEASNEEKVIFRMALSLAPKSVHLKEMDPAAIEAIIPAIETEYADLMAKTGKNRSEATSFFDQLFPSRKAHVNQRFFSIVNGDGEAIGQIWLMTHPSIPHQAHIMDIRINKDKQHQGYGKAALLVAEKVALKWGITHISLNVAEDNPSARKLYEKMGYEDYDRTKGKMQKKILAEITAAPFAAP